MGTKEIAEVAAVIAMAVLSGIVVRLMLLEISSFLDSSRRSAAAAAAGNRRHRPSTPPSHPPLPPSPGTTEATANQDEGRGKGEDGEEEEERKARERNKELTEAAESAERRAAELEMDIAGSKRIAFEHEAREARAGEERRRVEEEIEKARGEAREGIRSDEASAAHMGTEARRMQQACNEVSRRVAIELARVADIESRLRDAASETRQCEFELDETSQWCRDTGVRILELELRESALEEEISSVLSDPPPQQQQQQPQQQPQPRKSSSSIPFQPHWIDGPASFSSPSPSSSSPFSSPPSSSTMAMTMTRRKRATTMATMTTTASPRMISPSTTPSMVPGMVATSNAAAREAEPSQVLFLKTKDIPEQELRQVCLSMPGIVALRNKRIFWFLEFGTIEEAQAVLPILREHRWTKGSARVEFDEKDGRRNLSNSGVQVSPKRMI